MMARKGSSMATIEPAVRLELERIGALQLLGMTFGSFQHPREQVSAIASYPAANGNSCARIAVDMVGFWWQIQVFLMIQNRTIWRTWTLKPSTSYTRPPVSDREATSSAACSHMQTVGDYPFAG